MWVCSGSHSDSKARASASMARWWGSIAYSVGNIDSPMCIVALLGRREVSPAGYPETGGMHVMQSVTHETRSVACEPRFVAYGARSVACEPRFVAYGARSVACEARFVAY